MKNQKQFWLVSVLDAGPVEQNMAILVLVMRMVKALWALLGALICRETWLSHLISVPQLRCLSWEHWHPWSEQGWGTFLGLKFSIHGWWLEPELITSLFRCFNWMPEVGWNWSLDFFFFFFLFKTVESAFCLHCCKTREWLLIQAAKALHRWAPLNLQRGLWTPRVYVLACLEGLYHKYQLLPQTYFTVLCIEVLYGITSSAKSVHPYFFFLAVFCRDHLPVL